MKKMTISLLVSLCLATVCLAGVPVKKPRVLQTYPHDASAYTQGLFFWNGTLYESTGQNGKSSIRKVELSSGKVLLKTSLERKYFGEGAAIVGGKLYMLTWTSGTALVFDPSSLKLQQTLSYVREGWGLASLPPLKDRGKTSIPSEAVMVASDGSSSLYFLDSSLKSLKSVKVTLDGKPLRMLNELEWIGGRIWANVYTSDTIVIINPENGVVETELDCSDLIPAKKRTPGMDVLNGIALAPDGGIYLTGKNWPLLFRIAL